LDNKKAVWLGLVDLLYVFSYENRVTEGDFGVESAWTMCKLSPTISSLETFTSLKDVAIACIRRSLSYPLYRNWELSVKVLNDTALLFDLGKKAILKALLKFKTTLDHHDIYHVYSRLYLEDYCVWIQRAK
jgi:protein SHQ1